jgi:Protein of unknown function (DUF3159)
MVRAAGTAAAPDGVTELPDPTWAFLARRGLPQFAAEGIAPILVFYGAWTVGGLTAGVLAATVFAGAVLAWQIRNGRDGALARLALLFVAIQALVGLAAHSATVYLAQPVVLSAAWGVAYLVSAAIGRPLVGVFANAWYPFPPEFRAAASYRREFGLQSLVWGVFCLARAALRLVALLGSGVGGFVLVSIATGTPLFVALVFWGLWHARRTFTRLEDYDATNPVTIGQ